MGRIPSIMLAGTLLAVVFDGALFSSTAQAQPSRSHVCASDRPAAPAIPPPLVTPMLPAPGQATMPSEPVRPTPAAEPPSLMMGCVSRKHPLRKASLPDAQVAVTLSEAPQSAAAVYKFKSAAKRDERIGQWRAAMAPITSTPSALVSAEPMTMYIGGWANARWSFPNKRVIHAMFPESGGSGKLCLVRVDLTGRPEALAALNNWCMDSLGLWAD